MGTVLLKGEKTGEILYAIAYEDPMPGIIYLHAKDIGDARLKTLVSWKSKAFKRGTKIVGIAPVVGVFAEEVNKVVNMYG